MTYIVALIGILLCVLASIGAVRPAAVIDRVRHLSSTRTLREMAILVRFIIGCMLMLVAFDSAFPLTMLILGGLTVLAGVGLIFVDDARFGALLERVQHAPALLLQAGFAALFLAGLFLVYAVSV